VTLPTGTVTFAMTDIEGSTRLLAGLGHDYAAVLEAHRGIVRGALARHGGTEVETEGDSFFCAFPRTVDAVAAAVDLQRCLAAHAWPGDRPVRLRIGLHTGEGVLSGGGYVGMDVHTVARVSAAGHGGQVLLTAATHALLDGRWPAGVGDVPLGVHRLKDLPGPVTLYQVVAEGLDRRFPPPRTLEAPEYELPVPPTPIFGRDDDTVAVRGLLARARLVTLTGPGGVGKTRLALHVAALVRADFADGVVFVPLAEVRDPEQVPEEIARALALPPASYGGAGMTRLTGHLHDRRLLLVLDNVEQLGDGAEVVGRLLDGAPSVRVLATSRGALRLRGEQQYPVEPLTRSAAVEQFTERVHAVRPDLRLGAAELAAVDRIVDGVDGLPLAVELAAARVRTLTPGQIADRLGFQLGLLKAGPRDLPRRQQTIRETLLWSYELLDEPARRTFAAFAVLPGGASVEALEEIVPLDAPASDVLDCLDALVDQGLVRPRSDGTDRFGTLQVVRELAAEVLEDRGESDAAWRRAAQRLAALVERTAPLLLSDQPAAPLDLLQSEHDNLRAALEWATGRDPVLAAAIAAPVWRFWQMRGYLREGRAALEAVRDRLPDDAVDARYAVLTALGGVAYWQRDLPAGEAAYGAALDLARDSGDRFATAEALFNLAFPVWQQGRLAEAADLAARSGDLFAELGDDAGTGRVLWLRGDLALLMGFLAEAVRLQSESVLRHRTGRNAFQLGWSLRMLGRSLLLQGRAVEAREALEESLGLFAPSGDVSALVLHLADFALLAALEGDVDREVRLVGALRRLKELTGTELVDHPVNVVPGLEETLARLGAEGERLLAEGAAMSEGEAVRYALAPSGSGVQPVPGGPHAVGAPGVGLDQAAEPQVPVRGAG
jgi:predicted ATPase/class 3 adenylate cyclase